MAAKTLPGVFLSVCKTQGIPDPVPEFVFAPPRKWRFDWAWTKHYVALEIEGGAFRGPGHRSVGVFLRNIEKYNEAALLGWRVIRVTTDQFNSGDVFETLQRIDWTQVCE